MGAASAVMSAILPKIYIALAGLIALKFCMNVLFSIPLIGFVLKFALGWTRKIINKLILVVLIVAIICTVIRFFPQLKQAFNRRRGKNERQALSSDRRERTKYNSKGDRDYASSHEGPEMDTFD